MEKTFEMIESLDERKFYCDDLEDAVEVDEDEDEDEDDDEVEDFDDDDEDDE